MTKQEQLKSNRIKPKPSMKNKSKAIKDNDFMAWCHSKGLKCFSCGKKNGIELHHIKAGSTDIKDDTKVIPLCGVECHRLGRMLSAHGTPKLFREVYPIEAQLKYAERIYKAYKIEKAGE